MENIRNINEYLNSNGIKTEKELDVCFILSKRVIDLGVINIPNLKNLIKSKKKDIRPSR